MERVHGELQRKLHEFEDVGGPPGTCCPIGAREIETDIVARFIRWYNYDRPHESLGVASLETPAQVLLQVVLVLFTSDTTTKQDPIASKDEWCIDSRTPPALRHRHTDTSYNRTGTSQKSA